MDRGTAKERAWAWPPVRAAALFPVVQVPGLGRFTNWLTHALRTALAGEVAPGRLVPWLPIAFGLGVAIYFAAEREPSWIAATLLAIAAAVVAILTRRRAVAFSITLLVSAATFGFAVASLKSALIAHPVLDRPAYGVSLKGFVEAREERERSDRIVLKVVDVDDERIDPALDRIRISVRRGTAPAVGSYVALTARLTPPLTPLRPGGYDFARDLYFQGIGATGYVTGAIKVEAPPSAPGLKLRLLSTIDGMRDAIDRRIRAVAPGDAGSIASALITGKRDALTTPVNEALFRSLILLSFLA
jgi:competence protein ComEC